MSASNAQRATEGSDAASADRDDLLRRIFARTRTIAVVGMKDDPTEDACRIPTYMSEHGYSIVPVNPKLERALDTRAYADLGSVYEAGVTVDLVNVFRASENVPGHVDEILALDPLPKTVWLQLGIHHGPSAQRLREAGIDVIQDRCIMVDHRRIAATGDGSQASGDTGGSDSAAEGKTAADV